MLLLAFFVALLVACIVILLIAVGFLETPTSTYVACSGEVSWNMEVCFSFRDSRLYRRVSRKFHKSFIGTEERRTKTALKKIEDTRLKAEQLYTNTTSSSFMGG